jgi:1,4-dihydroxy-2-naphthoate polyprenyltransferase
MALKDFVRALRLPFVTASILPFMAGSLAAKTGFSILKFSLGLMACVLTHLGANLLNDYADSKSGADWQDTKHYGYFGGSKLIQEGIFSENIYAKWSALFFGAAFLMVIVLAVVMRNATVLFYSLAIMLLAAAYSSIPFQFSYRRLGECIVFILFGPAIVMGSYFIQTGIFPDLRSFLFSLPFGFLTTAILFANEVPDHLDDEKVGKSTWVSITGSTMAFIAYCALIILAFISIVVNVLFGTLKPVALISLVFIVLAIKAAMIIRSFPEDKVRLMNSSRLTVLLHTIVSIILIAGLAR